MQEESCPLLYDQLSLGSCVANATAAALRFAWQNCFLHLSTPGDEFNPSRLWTYYYARLVGNTETDMAFKDTGCQIRDAFRALKNKRVWTEEAWKYLSKEESKAGNPYSR